MDKILVKLECGHVQQWPEDPDGNYPVVGGVSYCDKCGEDQLIVEVEPKIIIDDSFFSTNGHDLKLGFDTVNYSWVVMADVNSFSTSKIMARKVVEKFHLVPQYLFGRVEPVSLKLVCGHTVWEKLFTARPNVRKGIFIHCPKCNAPRLVDQVSPDRITLNIFNGNEGKQLTVMFLPNNKNMDVYYLIFSSMEKKVAEEVFEAWRARLDYSAGSQ